MIGAGRDTKEDAIDPAVGVILEVKVGEKVDAGSVLCRLYYTKRRQRGRSRRDGGRRLPHLRQTARRARADPGSGRLARFRWAASPACSGLVVILGGRVPVLHATGRPSSSRVLLWGLGLQFAFAFLVLKTDVRQGLPDGHRRRRQRHARLCRSGQQVPVRHRSAPRAVPSA